MLVSQAWGKYHQKTKTLYMKLIFVKEHSQKKKEQEGNCFQIIRKCFSLSEEKVWVCEKQSEKRHLNKR